MIVTVFRSRVRADLTPDVLAKLEVSGARMVELASAMPGFVSYKDFAAEDGESVTVVEFDDMDHQRAWGEHPEHRAVQAWARENLFLSYQVQVCELQRVMRSEG